MHKQLLAITVLAPFLLLSVLSDARAQSASRKFGRSEYTWAVQWINNGLALFVEKGFVKKIVTKDDAFDVYVGKPWYKLDFNQQGEFLKNVSRAREITRHSPFFSVFDEETAATVGRVSGLAIEVLTPEEGFKQYRSVREQEQNTVY